VSHANGNIPRPLANAPIPLLKDQRTQMSFAERAALEGILCQLRPKLAVEVGVAEGGSLARLARHSARVHAFDLKELVGLEPHVRFHAGDSAVTLPAWLEDECPGDVDFALVDGDHTADGVQRDLLALLGSPVCQRTVVLVHDTANAEVREGVRRIPDLQGIVYRDEEFMAGYTFAKGPFAGQTWGGFGLFVTGDPRIDGYRDRPEQILYEPRSRA
jgi:hypothetical protein